MAKLATAFDSSVPSLMGKMLIGELKKKDCDFERVLILLYEGASLKTRDPGTGYNALDLVAYHGHHQAIAMAILQKDMGGNPAIDTEARKRAVSLAMRRGNHNVATVIVTFEQNMKQLGLRLTAQHNIKPKLAS